MNQTYIALDLETTGFDPSADQVLEVAAIKFRGDKILETFETLVNPGIEIPAMVSHITGISTETVKAAPSFSDISDNLGRFLGNFPIVGHNIDFDLTFLEAKGVPVLNSQIDTLKLSGILLSELPSLSLETISRQLKIKHENKHRALSDAKVCVELFQILLQKIAQIPVPILKQIQALIPRSEWELADLFLNTVPQPARPSQTRPAKSPPQKTTSLPLPAAAPEDFINILGEQSSLSTFIDKYEFRHGQQILLKKILQAFGENFNLIAEAGTGTGKTMAYLLAAGHACHFQRKKVIISTYTNNLQDQVLVKDFPLVQKLFPELKIAVLKGRKKYLDQNRFRQLLEKPHLEEHELTSIIKILIWLNHTETGDLDELNLQNKETQLYEEICADPSYMTAPEEYSASHLPSPRIDFLENARRKAESADIIVVNHALLIQDHLTDNKILPEAQILIADEAHHLEKTLTDGLTMFFSYSRLERQWDHLIESLESLKKTQPSLDQETLTASTQIRKLSSGSLQLAEKLFEKNRLLIEKFAKTMYGQPSQLGITQQIADSPEWAECLELINQMTLSITDLKELSDQLHRTLLKWEITDHPLQGNLHDLQNFFQNLKTLYDSPKNKIIWVNKGFDESIHLCVAPLSVKEIFGEKIFTGYQSVILTSATLSTYGHFSYIRSELGLDESFEEIKVPSHFSYPDQVKIIIPENLSDPKTPDYLPQCTKVIGSIINKNGGRTLVLFTAKKDLARVFHELAPSLKTEGINLLAQNISGGRGKIISHFQDEPANCAILGTNSFWEGVDLIGPVLTCVVIQKLPFDPPDDPIVRARSSLLEKPFEQYSLPRAILRFKQGFGRLIRSARDTGAVVILDSRLVQKSYGREFISSLPEGIKIHQCDQKEVADFL